MPPVIRARARPPTRPIPHTAASQRPPRRLAPPLAPRRLAGSSPAGTRRRPAPAPVAAGPGGDGGRRRHRRHLDGRAGRRRRDGRLGPARPCTAGGAGAAGARRAHPGGGVHAAGRRRDHRSLPAAGRALRLRATAGSTTTRRPATSVRASAAGTVVFAGPVAGSLHVTIRHADGVRTSYSFLQTVVAAVGAPVSAGDVVGTAGEHLHFGARVGDAYVDPAVLFSVATATVELLPFEVPPGSTPQDEARALLEVAIDEGDGQPAAALGPALRWLRRRVGDGFEVLGPLTGPAGVAGFRRGLDVAGELADRLLFPPPCSQGAPPVRPAASSGASASAAGSSRPRVAVTVAGLGSTSESAAIDDLRATDLGYDEGRVRAVQLRRRAHARPCGSRSRAPARPSVHVGRHPGRLPASPAIASPTSSKRCAPPSPGHRRRLRPLARWAGGPARAGSSSTGAGSTSVALGVVVTLASPHGGADLATAVSGAADAPRAGPALDVAADVLDLGLDPDAPVVDQLSEGSDAGPTSWPAPACPTASRLLSIAARGDLVVPSPHTRVAGATDVTVPVGRAVGRTARSWARTRPRPRSPGRSPAGRRAARRGTMWSATCSPATRSRPSKTTSASRCVAAG